MIADDIADALPELQAQAESRMVDTVRITTSAPGEETSPGEFDPPEVTVHYEGKARLRLGNPAPGATDAGETAWAVDRAVLSVPVSDAATVEGSVLAIADGMDVEMIAVGPRSMSTVGQHLTILGGHAQTDSTARRFPCQVVTHDA